MQIKNIITSESVGRGHPDKICDQIADAVLDACLKQDPQARVACEVFAHNRIIVIGGQITTKGYVDVVKVAWKVLKPIGYSENDFSILANINNQSADIAALVSKDETKLGAGDQGMTFSQLKKKYRYCLTNIKYYCSLYAKHGEKAFSDDFKMKFSREIKLNAVKRVLINHESCWAIAIELGLKDPTIVRGWVKNIMNLVRKHCKTQYQGMHI